MLDASAIGKDWIRGAAERHVCRDGTLDRKPPERSHGGDAVEALATTKAKVFAALRRVRRGTRAHARPSRSDELADG